MKDQIQQIQLALRTLEREWALTKESYHDKTADYFEHHYLQPLLKEIGELDSAAHELLKAIEKARRII